MEPRYMQTREMKTHRICLKPINAFIETQLLLKYNETNTYSESFILFERNTKPLIIKIIKQTQAVNIVSCDLWLIELNFDAKERVPFTHL